MKLRLLSLTLVLAMMFSFTGSAAAAQNQGGAAGLVAAVVQVAADLDDVVEVTITDSFNNLRALNNVLNNSPILSNDAIDITVGDVTVLQDFLNANNIDVDINFDDVVGVALLETGDLLVFI